MQDIFTSILRKQVLRQGREEYGIYLAVEAKDTAKHSTEHNKAAHSELSGPKHDYQTRVFKS